MAAGCTAEGEAQGAQAEAAAAITTTSEGIAVQYSRRPPVGRLSASQGHPGDLVSRLDFRRLSSPILVFEELLTDCSRGSLGSLEGA